jgi:hypothetical protein
MRYDFLWHVAYTLGVIPFSFAAYLLSASDMVWPRRIMARQLSGSRLSVLHNLEHMSAPRQRCASYAYLPSYHLLAAWPPT